MPTSRQRRPSARKGRAKQEEAPYTRLVQGVIADEEFGQLYRRAMWSFHRAATTQFGFQGEPEADAATARGLEWFLFGLTLPPKHLSPAEIWIERESEARGWAETTRREFLTLTTAQYGLFQVESALSDQYFTMTDRIQGGRYIGWNVAELSDLEPGAILAGWAFPAQGSTKGKGGRQSVVISPGSSVLPADVFKLIEDSGRLSQVTALEVEEFLGATPEWIADEAGAARARFILQEFLDDMSGGGMRGVNLTRELLASRSPAIVVMRLIDEIDPMTPVEPLNLTSLASLVWLRGRSEAGMELQVIEEETARWTQDLTRTFDAGDLQSALTLPTASATLTEHEVKRLRALPQEKGSTWIVEQRLIEVEARGPDGQPCFPECVGVFDSAGLRLLALEPVAADGKPLADRLLRTAIATMTGGARRPATVRVRSEQAAAQARALEAIGVAVKLVYLDPALEQAWDAISGQTEDGRPSVALPFPPAAPTGYLGTSAMSPADLGTLFAAATAFHAAAPWKTADPMRPYALKLEDGSWPQVGGIAFEEDEPLLVVTGGANAREFHLRVGLDEDAFEELLLEEESRPSERPSMLTLEFHDAEEVPPQMLEETRQHQLEFPSRQAIPVAQRTQPGKPMRPVDGAEGSLLTAVLRALTAFTKQHGREMASSPDELVKRLTVAGVGLVEVRVAPSL